MGQSLSFSNHNENDIIYSNIYLLTSYKNLLLFTLLFCFSSFGITMLFYTYFLKKYLVDTIFYYFLLTIIFVVNNKITKILVDLHLEELIRDDYNKSKIFTSYIKNDKIINLLEENHIIIRKQKILKSNNKNSEKCSICYDDINSKKRIIIMRCSHICCLDCTVEWCKIKNNCPLCRLELISEKDYISSKNKN